MNKNTKNINYQNRKEKLKFLYKECCRISNKIQENKLNVETRVLNEKAKQLFYSIIDDFEINIFNNANKGLNECILISHNSKELIEKTAIKLQIYFEDTGFTIYTKKKSDLDKNFLEIISVDDVYIIGVEWKSGFKDKLYNNEHQKQITEIEPIRIIKEIQISEKQMQDSQIQTHTQMQDSQIQTDDSNELNDTNIVQSSDDEFVIED